MTPSAILVTGAGGFVGRHLTAVLQARFPGATLHGPRFDVTDADAVAKAIRDIKPQACFHLAAIAAIPEARQHPDRAWQVNLHGTLNVARAILAHAPQCRLVYASSADTYGMSFGAGVALTEAAPLAPMNTYGATKAAADLALGAMARDGLDVIRVRPFNHTGPGQSTAFVVSAFAEQVARIAAGLQAPVLRVGDLEPQRDFLDVRDVCAAYAACLTADPAPGTILNVASGRPRRIRDVLTDLLESAGVDAKVETDPARLRPSDIPVAIGDATEARRVLHWEPAIAWRQTVSDLLEDWRRRVAAQTG